MARTGPVTRDTSTVALGLAQIRVSAVTTTPESGNIAKTTPVLTAEDSIGALAQTKFTSAVEYWRLTSGFPALEDMVVPLSESASLECQFKELSPYNVALAKGLDPSTFKADNHKGVIPLGMVKESAKVRMEAHYTFPDGVNTMTIIFPRAQVTASMELDFQAEDSANPSMTFEAKRADSEIEGGNSVWDNMPLGCIYYNDGSE